MAPMPRKPPLRRSPISSPASKSAPAPAESPGAKVNLLALDKAGLEAFCLQLGEKRFRATQLMKWIYQFGVDDFSQMTNLSKALRVRLSEVAEIRPPEVVLDRQDPDGTRKWLLRLADGNAVETVFIPEEGRGTLCVSSQVGCTLNCDFCATARQGYNRNLTVDEIIGQLWVANRALGHRPREERVITNVVLMGMGEPLLNFDNVVAAVSLMLDDHAYGLSRRRVTLSTAGVVPALDRLHAATGGIALAVSLHAVRDELRDRLVPLNKKYPIAELIAACKRYTADGRSRTTFEYVMLEGVNDSEEDARALARLLRGVPSKVNLIPFNPFPGAPYRRSPQRVIDRFREVLLQAGITAITRKTRGQEIDAACGQLAGEVQDRTRRSRRLGRQQGAA